MNDNRLGTPDWLTDALQGHFGPYDLDWCAEPWSAVVENFITEHQDVFKVRPHADHAFGNHPYGKAEDETTGKLGKGLLESFVGFARESVLEGRIKRITQLVPHYTAEGWWGLVEKPEGKVLGAEWRYGHIAHPRLANWKRLISEKLVVDIIAIKGRLKHRFPPRGYNAAREMARFSSVVVRFVRPGVEP